MLPKIKEYFYARTKYLAFEHVYLSDQGLDGKIFVGDQYVGNISNDELLKMESSIIKKTHVWVTWFKEVVVRFLLKPLAYSFVIFPISMMMILWSTSGDANAYTKLINDLFFNANTAALLLNLLWKLSFLMAISAQIIVLLVKTFFLRNKPTFENPNPFLAELEKTIRSNKQICLQGVMDIQPQYVVASLDSTPKQGISK